MNGHEAVIKLLLAMDAVDPNSKNNDDQTPLLLILSAGHEAMIKLLLVTNVGGVRPPPIT
jgi:ankyrin repeat protein